MLPDVCLVQRSFHFQFSFFHHCSNSNRYYNFSFTFSPGSFCSPFVCLIRRQFKTKNCLITFEVLNWLKFFSLSWLLPCCCCSWCCCILSSPIQLLFFLVFLWLVCFVSASAVCSHNQQHHTCAIIIIIIMMIMKRVSLCHKWVSVCCTMQPESGSRRGGKRIMMLRRRWKERITFDDGYFTFLRVRLDVAVAEGTWAGTRSCCLFFC